MLTLSILITLLGILLLSSFSFIINELSQVLLHVQLIASLIRENKIYLNITIVFMYNKLSQVPDLSKLVN